MQHGRHEAKAWAKETWRGVCNVIMPSFSADLRSLNEEGIRHDVRRNIELGFWGALLVSECATTLDEYRRFMEIAVDEARGRQHFLIQGVFDTREQIVEIAKAGEKIGVSGLLLGQPASLYLKTEADLENYLGSVANDTDLAVCLFATTQMNFSRFHTSGYPSDVLARVAEIPNVVAVKYEVGRPGIAGDLELYKKLKGTGVLFSDPLEAHSPLTVEMFGQQWMGTSNYEYWGGAIPEYFDLLTKGRFEEAMSIYWRINPARQARVAIQGTIAGSNIIHRNLWKYQGWLQGYNGGPMRQPVMKLNESQMRSVREPLVRCGFDVVPDDASLYYVGRHVS